jgi:thiamine pyrophosphate-dependent acetolactate synthase large subunit-like protein
VLNRREVVAAMLSRRGETLVVSGLGSPTYDVAAAGDHPANFYLWGAMGGAAMVGLGLALAQPSRRVLVVTGDGEMLMGLGSLATIGVEGPSNLVIAVIDNQHYGETGMQPGHTGRGVDLAAIARAANFAAATTIDTPEQLDDWIPRAYRDRGPLFAAIKVVAATVPMEVPVIDGTQLKNRFRQALLRDKASG